MSDVVWKPQKNHFKSSNIAKFITYINEKHFSKIDNYNELFEWSVKSPSKFWNDVSKFCEIKFSNEPVNIIKKNKNFIDTK